MARVLGIHGISQQFTSGPQLTRAWLDAVRGGLEVAGHRVTADGLAETDLRVGFFGDLFRPKGAMAGGSPPYTASDIKAGPETELVSALYEEALRIEPSLGPPPGSMGRGMVAMQVMLERLARSKTLAGVVHRRFIGDLKQVNQFLSMPSVKERVLERVHAEMNDTVVVVGHSLGSVVAYEYLCRYQPASVQLLVTIGCPLGIRNVVFDRLSPSPVDGVGEWPGGLKTWVNVADADDVVALRKELSGLFRSPNGGPGVQDRLVDNGGKPHAAERYLNSGPVGRALGHVL